MTQGLSCIHVFLIPGGEDDSLQVYNAISGLFAAYNDLELTIYRGQNRADRSWMIILIGKETAFSSFEAQIKRPLVEAHALVMMVPPERLVPLIQRFHTRQAQMLLTQTTFFEVHRGASFTRKKPFFRPIKEEWHQEGGKSTFCSEKAVQCQYCHTKAGPYLRPAFFVLHSIKRRYR